MLDEKMRIYWEFQTRDAEFQEIRIYEDGWLRWLNRYIIEELWAIQRKMAQLIHPDWNMIVRKETENHAQENDLG